MNDVSYSFVPNFSTVANFQPTYSISDLELRKVLVEEFGPQLADQIAKFFTSQPVLRQMHMAIEDDLVTMRDAHITVFGPAWIVHEKDDTSSSVMRVGTRDGLELITSYLTDKAQENQQSKSKDDTAD